MKHIATQAGFAGSSDVWIEANAPTLAQAEALHTLYSAAPELAEALLAIFEGDTMKGKENYTHADVIQKHYQIARQALQKAGLLP